MTMKASELVREPAHIIETDGDHRINISCVRPADESSVEKAQRYLVSEPQFVTVEDYEDHKEVSIRDWPY